MPFKVRSGIKLKKGDITKSSIWLYWEEYVEHYKNNSVLKNG